ncbi:penicillin acylase family protein [Tropicibacter naphthalenivorans]|uniref:Acyl-homoserine lactone acylase QuiP n=1 Tax=Tropicibacter naphthalenivorans TaxID=441103 RepID=A0A0P1G5K8_9RHOB|nr:penicillin acylase family protein [Tropicibacter naphthalenivorans]CUH76954.1 Acyl-homoserine lactone acylase QuiP precursor [Tropicibacter naphthalenivorans]SMC62010.1 penicillin amidase [Tropicibacter naphthalenivorans]
MALIFKWLFRLASAVVVLTVIGVFLAYYLASRSLPEYDKTLPVSGITADIEIVRDNNGVPHILSLSDRDAFFGLGYTHAQDRLWQMTLLRRTAQGRLSEIFGTRTADVDTLLRRFDLHRLAIESARFQDPRTLDALEAYSAGVNARIEEINARSLGRGAPEFFIFDAAIAPWQPADSIALVKLLALQLSDQLKDEVLRARTSLALDDDLRLSDILPDMPGTGTAALPDYASLFDVPLPRYAQATAQPDGFLDVIPPRGLAGASNAWAAAPGRSASQATILANDPHLGLTAPSVWYLARMNLQSGPVIGGSIPGIPSLLVGRSDSFGWALTSSYMDDQDLYIEELNPDDPQQYRTPTGWKRFETRKSIIEIKDAAPITVTLRWTDNGPVLPGSQFNLNAVTPPGHVASLAWTALSAQDTSMSAAIGLMMAQTIEDGIEAGRAFVAPSMNVTMADRTRVALQTVGAMPRRDPAHQSRGRMPSPGWIAQNRWQGMMPYSANPVFVAPQGGIVGNTNNKVVDRPFPNHMSYSWGDSQRVQRWQTLMQGRKVHTRDSFVEAQLDTVSTAARTLLPLIGRDLWYTESAAPEGTPERRRQEALRLLADWNGEMNEHMPEPLIYAAWLRALQDRLIRDDLGPLAGAFSHVEPLFIERVYRNVGGASAWCDVIRSARVETCTDIARLALDDALVWIGETYGTALGALRWGDAHAALHKHQTLGDVPVLRYFVNIRQSTSGGDQTLLRGRTMGTGPAPFTNVHSGAYRGVYDFADPDSSVFISSTGQSGHFLSRHYDDLGQLWRRGEYIPMSLDTDLARAASVGVTRLVTP